MGQLLSLALLLVVLGVAARLSMVPEPEPETYVRPSQEQMMADVARAIALLRTARGCEPFCPDEASRVRGRRVAREAMWQLDHPDRDFRDDCSGLVSAVFTAVGVPMDGVFASIYDLAAVHGAIHFLPLPLPGDLVFFNDTHDRNGNGRWDDPLTHIALVVDVEPDGTVVFAHAGLSSGRGLGRLHVGQPFVRRSAEGKEINSYLREPARGDPPTAGYLAGALWVGFARVDPELDWHTPPPPPESWP